MQGRTLGSLIIDELMTRAVKRMRVRASSYPLFLNLAVPIDDFISARVIATGRFEATQIDGLTQLLENPQQFAIKPPTGTLIDVGANIGLFTVALSHFFDRTVAIEANPATFTILQANMALRSLDSVQCLSIAVSNRTGDATIHIPTNGNLGWASLEENSGFETKGVKVRCDKLDNIVAELGPELSIGMIKIDVEHHEYEVLEGARKILRERRPLVLFEAMSDSEARRCATLLQECGYSRFISFRRRGRFQLPLKKLKVSVEEYTFESIEAAPLICAVPD